MKNVAVTPVRAFFLNAVGRLNELYSMWNMDIIRWVLIKTIHLQEFGLYTVVGFGIYRFIPLAGIGFHREHLST